MDSTLQAIIIAFLVGFLIAILIGYFPAQRKLKRHVEALKDSQRRLEEIERAHEARLRETTENLRRDYEAELAETIEHYQDQLSQKTLELEQTYETRFQVLQQGGTAATLPLLDDAPAKETRSSDSIIPPPPPPPSKLVAKSDADKADESSSRSDALHLKRQYELRLKEAAQKLQQAYEKQLAQHVSTVKADLQAEYDKRLHEQIDAQEQQLADRKAQLEEEYASRIDALASSEPEVPVPFETVVAAPEDAPTPSQIMDIGDDTTVTLSPSTKPPVVQTAPSPQYIQEEVDARIQEMTQKIRQDYDQQLSAKLDEHQQRMNARLKELESEYSQRFEKLARSLENSERSTNSDDDLGPLDLSDINRPV